MPDREKLIELLKNIPQVNHAQAAVEGLDCVFGCAADHLISHGVTVRERGRWETIEVTEDWEDVERYRHFHKECKYSYCDNGLGGHYFCPNCGADMRGEEDGK